MNVPRPPNARAAFGEFTSAWNRLIRRFSRSWFSGGQVGRLEIRHARHALPPCGWFAVPSVTAWRPQVHIIGASGRSGAALCRSLLGRWRRRSSRWCAMPRNGPRSSIGVPPRIADLTDPAAPARALADATRIVSCAHARHAPRCSPPRRPRRASSCSAARASSPAGPTHTATACWRARRAFLASGRSGVMLHPTMIYGAQGEDNVQRLAALLRRLPFVPLPGGGAALVQPIHQDDVTRAIRAALDRVWDGPAFAGDRRACPPALRRFRPRRRRRERTARTAHRRLSRPAPLMALAGILRYIPFAAADSPRRDPPADGRQELRRASDDRHARRSRRCRCTKASRARSPNRS